MKAYTVFKEYIWLVNTIRRAGKITLAEINEKWRETDMSGGVDFARATFNRHKDAIQDIFGIYIECDRKAGNKYYIGNSRVLDENSVQNWMLSTLSVSNILSESIALRERILLESVPSEGDYLQMIIEAMQKNVRVAVDYQRYSAASPRHLTMEPYCLKLFRQRWYMLGHFHRDATPEKPEADYFGIFSLDRIKHIELTDIKFKVKKDFDAKEYFSEYFGVTTGDGTDCERVVLRAYGEQRFYMRDLPWHHSQTEIASNDDYSDFEFIIRPTIDFSNKIVSEGNRVKVITPLWLADEIREMHLDAVKMYDEE